MRGILFCLGLFFVTFSFAGQKENAPVPSNPVIIKDTKIGPLVGIQRVISGIYDSCMSNIVGDVNSPMFLFSCSLDIALDSSREFVTTANPIFRFNSETCMVEANLNRNKLGIFFGNPKAPLTLDEARLCLEVATNSMKNQVELLVFKVDGPSAKR